MRAHVGLDWQPLMMCGGIVRQFVLGTLSCTGISPFKTQLDAMRDARGAIL